MGAGVGTGSRGSWPAIPSSPPRLQKSMRLVVSSLPAACSVPAAPALWPPGVQPPLPRRAACCGSTRARGCRWPTPEGHEGRGLGGGWGGEGQMWASFSLVLHCKVTMHASNQGWRAAAQRRSSTAAQRGRSPHLAQRRHSSLARPVTNGGHQPRRQQLAARRQTWRRAVGWYAQSQARLPQARPNTLASCRAQAATPARRAPAGELADHTRDPARPVPSRPHLRTSATRAPCSGCAARRERSAAAATRAASSASRCSSGTAPRRGGGGGPEAVVKHATLPPQPLCSEHRALQRRQVWEPRPNTRAGLPQGGASSVARWLAWAARAPP